ncbi:TetR/AcrR family transcriptional regulator [Tundrisphaera sp. TA3]|uniref:TetR/AcrR family transcriptional regulator n=1 Tax=Tundrisphaera sp. TA3 TaxID=3435775 RepID=UPI003EBF1502
MSGKAEGPGSTGRSERRLRADARRNVDALLEAAKAVFLASGVDAPVREIAERAGVGIGTIYRHFPRRSDLIVAVFRREVDACADAAPALAAEHGPEEAMVRWIRRFVEFISAKRGLAAALHSGDPAYCALPAYFQERLVPAFQGLLEAAAAAGKIRSGVEPYDFLRAVASLSTPGADVGPDHARRMVDLLIDGLRYGASAR